VLGCTSKLVAMGNGHWREMSDENFMVKNISLINMQAAVWRDT
jgi:hypothetical protein